MGRLIEEGGSECVGLAASCILVVLWCSRGRKPAADCSVPRVGTGPVHCIALPFHHVCVQLGGNTVAVEYVVVTASPSEASAVADILG